MVMLALATATMGVSVVGAAQQVQTSEPLPRAETRERNLRAYTELLRSDLRTQKVAVITQMMQLTDAEDAAFWPIYREYELELSRVYDERLATIEAYVEAYSHLTAATADEIAVKALDQEARRVALKQKYYTTLKKALSPVRAAKALQIENQIQLLVDLQVAASLPVVP